MNIDNVFLNKTNKLNQIDNAAQTSDVKKTETTPENNIVTESQDESEYTIVDDIDESKVDEKTDTGNDAEAQKLISDYKNIAIPLVQKTISDLNKFAKEMEKIVTSADIEKLDKEISEMFERLKELSKKSENQELTNDEKKELDDLNANYKFLYSKFVDTKMSAYKKLCLAQFKASDIWADGFNEKVSPVLNAYYNFSSNTVNEEVENINIEFTSVDNKSFDAFSNISDSGEKAKNKISLSSIKQSDTFEAIENEKNKTKYGLFANILNTQ